MTTAKDQLEALLESDVLKTDDLMAVVRSKMTAGGSSSQRVGAIEMLEHDALDVMTKQDFVLPEILLGGQEWELEPSLHLTSHRKITGRFIVGLKRLVMPLVGWLLDYSQKNFMRQRRLNHALIASVETLAAKNAALEHRVELLQEHLSKDRDGATQAPTSSGPLS